VIRDARGFDPYGAGLYYGPCVPLTGRAGADIYGDKGIPVVTNGAPFEEEQVVRSRLPRRQRADDTAVGATVAPAPSDRERAICVAAISVFAETFPVQHRRGMTTVRLRQVAEIGAATLLCDCLHEGPHEWPPALQPIVMAPSAGNGVEEGEVLGEGVAAGDGADDGLVDAPEEGS